MDTIELTYRFTGKEVDEETGLYYYGARYLDPRTSRWLSTDPALGEYIPGAPVNEEAKKANQNLPGMGGVFNVVNFQLYHYAGNNPVKYVDPDGREMLNHITLKIVRNEASPASNYDKAFRGLDYAVLTNLKTGEKVYLIGGQTVVSHANYPKSNTLMANNGMITFQYLGNNRGTGQSLYGGYQSTYKGPVLNVTLALTEGFNKVNESGQIQGSSDIAPIRIHSDTKVVDNSRVPLASGGCPMFPIEQLDKMQEALERWGVTPGDTFTGYIEQQFPE